MTWFSIIKSKYGSVLRQLIPSFLETINIGDSFNSTEIIEWATQQQDGEYINVDSKGNPYAAGFPIKDQFPTAPAVTYIIREEFKRDIDSTRLIGKKNITHQFTRIR